MQILSTLGSMGAYDRVIEVAKTEKDADVRNRAIRSLGNMRSERSGQALVETLRHAQRRRLEEGRDHRAVRAEQRRSADRHRAQGIELRAQEADRREPVAHAEEQGGAGLPGGDHQVVVSGPESSGKRLKRLMSA